MWEFGHDSPLCLQANSPPQKAQRHLMNHSYVVRMQNKSTYSVKSLHKRQFPPKICSFHQCDARSSANTATRPQIWPKYYKTVTNAHIKALFDDRSHCKKNIIQHSVSGRTHCDLFFWLWAQTMMHLPLREPACASCAIIWPNSEESVENWANFRCRNM